MAIEHALPLPKTNEQAKLYEHSLATIRSTLQFIGEKINNSFAINPNWLRNDEPFSRGSVTWARTILGGEIADTEKALESNPYDWKLQRKLTTLKERYGKVLELQDIAEKINDQRDKVQILQTEVAQGSSLPIHLELSQTQLQLLEQELKKFPELSTLVPEFIDRQSSIDVLTQPQSHASNLAAFVNISTFIARHWFSYFPFPHFDKFSDIPAFLHEPMGQTRAMKLVITEAIEKLAKRLAPEKAKELFLYHSMTKAEIYAAAAWYGGLWITSELTFLAPIHPLAALGFVADLADIPSYLLGIAGQFKVGHEIIKRFPPGRLADMEKSANIALNKHDADTKAKSESIQALRQSLTDPTRSQESAKFFLQEYRNVYQLVVADLLRRSQDVLQEIKKDPAAIELYKEVVINYARALCRHWYLRQLHGQSDLLIDETIDHHQKKLDLYKTKIRKKFSGYRSHFVPK